MISPEVFVRTFSHTTSVRRHTRLILLRSNMAGRWNPTQATEALAVTPMYSQTLAGSREIRDGCRLCCLSTLLTFLWVNPTIVLRWISGWCYIFCDERALEPLMYSQEAGVIPLRQKMRSCLRYEREVISKIACISLFGSIDSLGDILSNEGIKRSQY